MASTRPRTALITGAGQGIGADLVRRLSTEGWEVVALDRNAEALDALSAELDGLVKTVTCDLGDPNAIERMWAEIPTASPVDLLVNNAAMTHLKSLWDITLEEWDAVCAVNQRAVFWLSRLAGESMRTQGWGRIVNIASLAGQAARPSGAHYAATKGAVIALTRVFAAELADAGVTVNAVAPGTIETPMTDALSNEVRDRLSAQIPVGRLGRTTDIAAAVSYLASENAGFITGATLDLNGGVLMR